METALRELIDNVTDQKCVTKMLMHKIRDVYPNLSFIQIRNFLIEIKVRPLVRRRGKTESKGK